MNLNNLEQFYGKNYKILMTIPIVITILATIFVIGFYIKTGDIIHKDVSLKGGITATVYTENQIDLNEIKNNLNIESDIRKLSDFTTGKQIGFIAQDVEKVFPQWVEKDGEGYKTLTLRGFEALAVESIRELKKENDSLKEANKQLESRLKALEEKIGK